MAFLRRAGAETSAGAVVLVAILFGALGCSSSALPSGNTGGGGGTAGTAGTGGGASGAAGTAGTTGLDGGSGAGGASDGGVGAPCQNADDCAGSAVCDPQTAKCSQTATCGNSNPCPSGQTCELVSGSKAAFTCFVACTPSATNPQSSCPSGFVCLAAGGVEIDGGVSSSGACFRVGSAAQDASCTATDISTGCASSHDTCSDDGDGSPTVCRSDCDRTAADPGCPAGQACDIRDVCLPISKIEQVSIGAACSNVQGNERACGGVSNGNVVGYCGGAGLQQHCDRICDHKAPVCPNGTTCSQPLDKTIQQFGICL